MTPLPDSTALDQIAAALGLWNTDPQNNPGEVLTVVSYYVTLTGRSVDVPEGA